VSRRESLTLLAICVFAIAWQFLRWPLRWNPIAVAYGAYVAEYRFAIQTGPWHAPLTHFVGLHPPAWPLAFLAGLKAHVPAGGWLVGSALASWVAVPACAAAAWTSFRSAPLALGTAAVVALLPHRIAYGLEVNNYPAIVGLSALQAMAFAAWARGGRGAPLLVTTAALAWTHVLGLLLPAAQLAAVLLLPEGRARRAEFGRLMAGAALLALPLVPGAVGLLGEEPINAEAGLGRAWQALTSLLPGRYGAAWAAWLSVALASAGAVAAWRTSGGARLAATSWALHVVGGGALVIAAMASGAASPEQLPYFTLLAPSFGLLIALGLRPVWEREAAPATTAPSSNGPRVEAEVRPGAEPGLDPPAPSLRPAPSRRAQGLALAALAWSVGVTAPLLLDTALAATDPRFPDARAQASAWAPDEVLLLVQIPWYLDDDKDAGDPVWRGLRGGAWNYADPGVPGLTPTDPYWGQPMRTRQGGWLYTFTSPDADRLAAVSSAHTARGQTVRVAAYGLDKDPRGARRLQSWLGAAGRSGAGELTATLRP